MKITVVAILAELLVSISFHSEYDDMSVMHLSIIKSNWDTKYNINRDELAECSEKKNVPRPTKKGREKKLAKPSRSKKSRLQQNANYCQTKYNGITK